MMELEVSYKSCEEEVKINVHKKFGQALGDLKPIILPAAQAIAPVQSGRYKRSLGFAVDEKTLEAAFYSGGKAAPHAHLVEWGSHKMAPYGTMRKVAEQMRDAMGKTVVKRMEEPV